MQRKTVRSGIFIDPGLEGTGWAFFPYLAKQYDLPEPPSAWGVIRPKGETLDEKCIYLRNKISCLLNSEVFVDNSFSFVMIEYPQLWSGHRVSMTAALKGDLIKLTYVAGFVGGILAERGIFVITVRVNEWKGNLSKNLVARRVYKHIGEHTQIPNHAMDAVGMGYSYQGAL